MYDSENDAGDMRIPDNKAKTTLMRVSILHLVDVEEFYAFIKYNRFLSWAVVVGGWCVGRGAAKTTVLYCVTKRAFTPLSIVRRKKFATCISGIPNSRFC